MTSWSKHWIGVCALILCALTLAGCPSGGGQLEWVFPLDQVDTGESIAQLPDGGYFVSGDGLHANYTSPNLLLATARISSTGSLIWGKLVDGMYSEGHWTLGAPVTATEFVVVGLSAPYDDSTGRLRVLKLDTNGNALWDRTYGQDTQQPSAVNATGDGGCVIACQRTVMTIGAKGSKTNTYTYQVVLRKLDSLGGVVWERYLESPTGFMGVYRMTPLSDGGFVLVGADSQILRVDAEGNALWWNLFSQDWATAHGVGVAPDGGFVLVGASSKSLPTPVVFKTDANGNLLWTAENIIPNQGTSQYTVRDGIVDTQGRIVIVGQLERVTYIGNFFPVISYGSFIMQLDASAHLNWSKAFDVYEINGVTQTSTGDYSTVGSDGNHLQVIRVSQSGAVM